MPNNRDAKIKVYHSTNDIFNGIIQNIELLKLQINKTDIELQEIKIMAYNNFSEIREMAVNSQRKFDVIFDELEKMKDSNNA